MPGYTPTKPYGSGPRPPERRIAPAARRRGKTCGEPRFLELKKQDHEVYYRKKQGEVDFVVKHPHRSLSAIDVSYTDTLPAPEEKALLEFADLHSSQVRSASFSRKTWRRRTGRSGMSRSGSGCLALIERAEAT